MGVSAEQSRQTRFMPRVVHIIFLIYIHDFVCPRISDYAWSYSCICMPLHANASAQLYVRNVLPFF